MIRVVIVEKQGKHGNQYRAADSQQRARNNLRLLPGIISLTNSVPATHARMTSVEKTSTRYEWAHLFHAVESCSRCPR